MKSTGMAGQTRNELLPQSQHDDYQENRHFTKLLCMYTVCVGVCVYVQVTRRACSIALYIFKRSFTCTFKAKLSSSSFLTAAASFGCVKQNFQKEICLLHGVQSSLIPYHSMTKQENRSWLPSLVSRVTRILKGRNLLYPYQVHGFESSLV